MIEFAVGLTDKVSAPANRMAKSLTTVADRTKFLEGTVKSLEKQMAKAQALGNTTKVAQLASQHGALSTALEKSGGGTSSFSAGLAKLSGELGPAIAIVAAYTAALGGLAVAFYEGAKLALSASAFKRESISAFSAIAGSAKVGKETMGVVRELSKVLPESEATLVERAKGLLAQGLDPAQLKSSLMASSNIAAALGEQAAAKLASIQERITTSGKFNFSSKALKGTGITEAELAKQLGLPTPAALERAMKAGAIAKERGIAAMNAVANKKYGGLALEKMDSMEGISNKLHDSLARIFEGVDTKPFTQGLRSIVGMLDESTGSGKVLRSIVNTIFGGAFAKSGGLLLAVKHGLQDIMIAGIKVYIAMKPVIAEMKTIWTQAKNSEKLKTALKGLAIAVGVVAGAIILGGLAMLAIGAATMACVATIALGVGLAIGFSFKLSESIRKRLMKWPAYAKSAAAGFIDGIVHGLSKGIGKIKSAVSAVASVLPKGVADKLQIHSPSRVGMKQGEQYGEGVAIGAERSRAGVTRASTALATKTADGTGGGGAKGGRRSATVNVGGVTIQVTGGDKDSIRELTVGAFQDIFEQLALSEGLGT